MARPNWQMSSSLSTNEHEKYLLNKVVIFHPWFCFNFMCHREGNTRQVFLGDNLQKLHEKDIELHHILLASIMQEGNKKRENEEARKETEMKLPFLLLLNFCLLHLEVRYYGKKMFK